MNVALLDFLKKQDVEYKRLKLSSISPIRIGGMAAVIAPRTENELIDIVDFMTAQDIRYIIVGRMTNILPCDEEFDGVIIQTKEISYVRFYEDTVIIGAGTPFSFALTSLVRHDIGGAEPLYGIPGSLGGMIASNAGAFGSEISDFVKGVEAYDPRARKRILLQRGELGFAYRRSVFKESDLIVLSARLKLHQKSGDLIKKDMEHYSMLRRTSQPISMPSLGSVFKRRNDVPISYLIDKAGLKGLCVGGASVSDKHAGFIVNRGGATCADVIRLIQIIKETLYNRYGIMPEEEIEYLKGKIT